MSGGKTFDIYNIQVNKFGTMVTFEASVTKPPDSTGKTYGTIHLTGKADISDDPNLMKLVRSLVDGLTKKAISDLNAVIDPDQATKELRARKAAAKEQAKSTKTKKGKPKKIVRKRSS